MRLLNFTQFVNENINNNNNIYEETTGLEPVFTPAPDSIPISFCFGIGQSKLKLTGSSVATGELSETDVKALLKRAIEPSKGVIIKFYEEYVKSNRTFPAMVQFYVGTSSSGDATANAQEAENRMKYLTGLYLQVMRELTFKDDVAYRLMTQAPKNYKPATVNNNVIDSKRLKEIPEERICQIIINPITTMGRDSGVIDYAHGELSKASSIINTIAGDNVDEDKIVNALRLLQTYSDIADLDRSLQTVRSESLEEFLNTQLAYRDSADIATIVSILNTASNRSGKGNVAKVIPSNDVVGSDKIAIMLNGDYAQPGVAPNYTQPVQGNINPFSNRPYNSSAD